MSLVSFNKNPGVQLPQSHINIVLATILLLGCLLFRMYSDVCYILFQL